MTQNDRELIERLRAVDHMSVEECFLDSFLFAKSADRLEALSAEVERYRAALGSIEHAWVTFMPDTDDFDEGYENGLADAAQIARQALKGANNG